jgi:hypothetical protein
MSPYNPAEDVLIQRIKTAFPRAFQSPGMTHSECVQLRPKLIAISAVGFEQAFAQVLLDLVESHTGRAGQPENAEEVVRFLDVQDDSSCLENLPGYSRERERETDKLLAGGKIESLADITPQQAKVVMEWLEAAKNWPDLAWYRDEVESALAYWSKRAAE